MNKIGLLIVAGALGLAGCSSTSPSKTVETINALTVPVSYSEPGVAANNPQAVTRYFQDNTALIGRLNHSLKSNYLQDVERRDVFDRHSEAYQVYGALTRLKQMASMNEVYRKENNVAGLQEINRVLKSVPQAS
ncbi:hypothetical protein FK479_08185 [Klebsiella quasipneumoniae]|nr:hypothetical protein [Klebsiella quasipneumoniae]